MRRIRACVGVLVVGVVVGIVWAAPPSDPATAPATTAQTDARQATGGRQGAGERQATGSQAVQSMNAADPDASGTTAQNRDPFAEELIRKLAQQASERKAFRFKFADEFDDVRADGSKIQISHVRQGTIRRPDRFKVESTGDVSNRTLFKDGKTITVWDRDENIYAQVPDPGTIDQALDLLMSRYRMPMPAADLFYADPGETFLKQMTGSEYVGLSDVDGVSCHHVAFSGDEIDWQMWIDAGEKVALKKLVIDYKHLPGRPEYSLTILQTEPLDAVDESEFRFTPPVGSERVEVRTTAPGE